MKKYRDILFDADNTLLDFTRAEHDALAECFAAFGLPSDDDHIKIYSEINDKYWKMLERGEIEKSKLYYMRFQMYCENCGFSADAMEINKLYIAKLSTKSYLIDGAYELCRKLYGKYDLNLITNGHKKVQEGRFSTSPISVFFKKSFISEEVGFEKPSTGFFDEVEKAIPGFSKDKALVVGDSLTSDILGGINAGIDTCYYNPANRKAPDNMPITYTINTLAGLLDIL